MPTKLVRLDGKYFAKVNSLTNSIYAIISYPVSFADLEGHWAKDAINNMGSRMIVSGFENEQFYPDQGVTRGEFAAIVVRALGLKLHNYAAPFSDVAASEWYSSYIQTAYDYDLINGYGEGTFGIGSQSGQVRELLLVYAGELYPVGALIH